MKLSKKQKLIYNWWVAISPYKDKRGIIADGSIRAGKTFSMRQSFVLWAMINFNKQSFGICGKTIGSIKRNILKYLQDEIKEFDMDYTEKYVDGVHCLTVSSPLRKNDFYLFAGNDESSQNLIQGITLAGVYLDEVVLMPESFVNQATARCSVDKSKLWFNCNPESPYHYFKKEWIDKRQEKNLLYIHFEMFDNPSLSSEMLKIYESMYSGVFYQRFIKGQWVLAEGIVYDMWREETMTYEDIDFTAKNKRQCDHYIAIDYGTVNPMRYLSIYFDGETIWVDNEYNWDAREQGRQKTDNEYLMDYVNFENPSNAITVIDPSASSFKTLLRQEAYYVQDANNDVIDGIRVVASLIAQGRIKVHKRCIEILKEFANYRWDEKLNNKGKEQVIKQYDHSLDALRYFCMTMLPEWMRKLEKLEERN